MTDAPDELWYQCTECDGEGTVDVPDVPDDIDWDTVGPIETEEDAAEAFGTVQSNCDRCGGTGVMEGYPEDADLAEELGWVRVDP